ncbi:MAG: RNase H family protein [Brevinemataceae bacterium]
MSISKNELTAEAEKFIIFLNNLEITAKIIPNSFRDYHVKLLFFNSISATLYHKPSKQQFTLSTHEIQDAETKYTIDQLWHQYKFPEEFEPGLCAYTDGSFTSGKIGWGLVLTLNNSIIEEKYGIVPLSPEAGAHQIAGEIQAVLEALEYAQTNNIKEISIYYDYAGLEMWATKKWKAQSPIAQYYTAKLMQYRITIKWKKIAAHTGHIFNERADLLAKTAVS